MTDPLGQSQVIPYLAGLTKYGYEFTILSSDKPDKYAANKAYVLKLLEPYPIKWVSVPYHKNPPVLSSLFDYFQLKKTAVRLHKKAGFDLVHTRPGLPTIVALHLQKKWGLKVLNDVRGFWPDERVDGGMWNLKNPVFKMVYRFFKKHELACLIKADAVTCLTYAARKELQNRKDIPGQPIDIEVIPCSVDLELFNPEQLDLSLRAQFKSQLGFKEDDFVVTYLGSIGGWYMTDEMLQFCKHLSERIPAAKFLFISPGDHELIKAAANKAGLPANQLLIQQGKRHEIPVLLSFSTYSLFFIKPCFSKISSSPTKHGEIMAMGIPVITNAGVGDVAEIVHQFEGGFVLNDFSNNSYKKVIDLIVDRKAFNKDKIRNGAQEFYSLENAIQKYLKVYQNIFKIQA